MKPRAWLSYWIASDVIAADYTATVIEESPQNDHCDCHQNRFPAANTLFTGRTRTSGDAVKRADAAPGNIAVSTEIDCRGLKLFLGGLPGWAAWPKRRANSEHTSHRLCAAARRKFTPN